MTDNTSPPETIQAELDRIDYASEEIQRRQKEIEFSIADNWQKDTGKLQAEYASLDARLKAADLIKERLIIDLDHARQLKALDDYRPKLQAWQTTKQAIAEHRAALDRLQAEMNAHRQALSELKPLDHIGSSHYVKGRQAAIKMGWQYATYYADILADIGLTEHSTELAKEIQRKKKADG